MIAQSGLLCNSLSFRRLRPQGLMRPSPGGATGFAPAGLVHLADGLRCASRRAGGDDSGPARPGPGYLSAGLTQPRAPGFTFVRTKVNRKSASPLWAGPRLLPNRTSAQERCAATETPRFGWLLVIGLVIVLLRLTALVLIGTSCRAKQRDGFTPSKGRIPPGTGQPESDKKPATD